MNMRKNYFWIFFLLVLLLSFSASFPKAYAIEEDLSASSSSSQQAVSYELPYPGLLPDSPLYFLRAIRDKITGFLISDPLIKAEFNLLQADKRLNAGIYLFNKGKTSLALSTISKAENYFDEALNKVGEAKMEGKHIDEMKGKLKQALAKHQEELDKLIKKTDKNPKASFEKEQKRTISFAVRLGQ
jgi:hypothetical protein